MALEQHETAGLRPVPHAPRILLEGLAHPTVKGRAYYQVEWFGTAKLRDLARHEVAVPDAQEGPHLLTHSHQLRIGIECHNGPRPPCHRKSEQADVTAGLQDAH